MEVIAGILSGREPDSDGADSDRRREVHVRGLSSDDVRSLTIGGYYSVFVQDPYRPEVRQMKVVMITGVFIDGYAYVEAPAHWLELK
jgi:hypothetical protein